MRARAKDPKLAALERVPLFAGLTASQLRAVARVADELDLPAGKLLIREGERGRQFFVLLEGGAVVRRRGRRVNALGPGDFFGEIALVSDRETTATVTITDPSRAVVLTRSSFKRLLRDSPAVQLRVLEALVERLPDD